MLIRRALRTAADLKPTRAALLTAGSSTATRTILSNLSNPSSRSFSSPSKVAPATVAVSQRAADIGHVLPKPKQAVSDECIIFLDTEPASYQQLIILAGLHRSGIVKIDRIILSYNPDSAAALRPAQNRYAVETRELEEFAAKAKKILPSIEIEQVSITTKKTMQGQVLIAKLACANSKILSISSSPEILYAAYRYAMQSNGEVSMANNIVILHGDRNKQSILNYLQMDPVLRKAFLDGSQKNFPHLKDAVYKQPIVELHDEFFISARIPAEELARFAVAMRDFAEQELHKFTESFAQFYFVESDVLLGRTNGILEQLPGTFLHDLITGQEDSPLLKALVPVHFVSHPHKHYKKTEAKPHCVIADPAYAFGLKQAYGDEVSANAARKLETFRSEKLCPYVNRISRRMQDASGVFYALAKPARATLLNVPSQTPGMFDKPRPVQQVGAGAWAPDNVGKRSAPPAPR